MTVGTTKHTNDTKRETSDPPSVFLFVSFVYFVV
jgi:hypothetical protein